MTEWGKSYRGTDDIAARLLIKRWCTWTGSEDTPLSSSPHKKSTILFINYKIYNISNCTRNVWRCLLSCVSDTIPKSNISTAGWRRRAPSTFPSVPLIDDPGIDLNSLQIASLTLTWSKLRRASCFFFPSSTTLGPLHLYSHKAPSSVVGMGNGEKWSVVLQISPTPVEQKGRAGCCCGAVEGLSCPLLDELQLGPEAQRKPDQWSSGWRDLLVFFPFSSKVIINMSKACEGRSSK